MSRSSLDRRLHTAIKRALALNIALSMFSLSPSPSLQAAEPESEALAKAEQALAKGDVLTAENIYEQLVRQGEVLPAELGQVRVALQRGEFRKAVAHANLTAGEHPESPAAGALLAVLLDSSGRTEQALTTLRTLETQYPDEWQPVAAHAGILIERLAAQQAIELIDCWLAQRQGDAPVELRRLLLRAHVANNDAVSEAWQTTSTRSAWTSTWVAPSFQSLPIATENIYSAGNGVVIEQGTTVLTYATLLQGSSGKAWVRNGMGKVRRAEVDKYLGVNNEWVRLKLREPFPAAWSIKTSQVAAPEGTRFCFLFGFGVPRSVDPAYPGVTSGLVLRTNAGVNDLLQITSAVGEGHDGAPVFDVHGRLLGLALNNGEHQIGSQSLRKILGAGTFVMRADSVLHSEVVKTVALPPAPSVEELYERLSPAVVQIVVVK